MRGQDEGQQDVETVLTGMVRRNRAIWSGAVAEQWQHLAIQHVQGAKDWLQGLWEFVHQC